LENSFGSNLLNLVEILIKILTAKIGNLWITGGTKIVRESIAKTEGIVTDVIAIGDLIIAETVVTILKIEDEEIIMEEISIAQEGFSYNIIIYR